MVKKIYTTIGCIMCFFLVACSDVNDKNTLEQETTSKQEEMSDKNDSTKESTSEWSTTENTVTEQTTIYGPIISVENESAESETLYYELYDQEKFDELAEPILNVLSEQVKLAIDDDNSHYVCPLAEEYVLLEGMKINPTIDNDLYSVETKISEYYDDKWPVYVQMMYPYITINGNTEATKKANEEIKKVLLEGFYGLTDEEITEKMYIRRAFDDVLNYYCISYMDEGKISFIIRTRSRLLQGVTIDVKTGELITLADMGISDEDILNILQKSPDHIVSDFYDAYSRNYLSNMIKYGFGIDSYFIKDNTLYLGECYNKSEFIYLGYDNVLELKASD